MPLPPRPYLLPLEPLPPMTAAELKRFRREELSASQAVAASLLGVSIDTVRKWEQGVHPVTETATRLVELWRRLSDPGTHVPNAGEPGGSPSNSELKPNV